MRKVFNPWGEKVLGKVELTLSFIFLLATTFFLYTLSQLSEAIEVIVVDPHISISPPFSPQYRLPGVPWRFDFVLINDGYGDVQVIAVSPSCPLNVICSVEGFTSGKLVEGENVTTTLEVRLPHDAEPGEEFIVGISVEYDDAYGLPTVGPKTALSNTTLKSLRAKLVIEKFYLENITKVDGRWIVVVHTPHRVKLWVTNVGNLRADNVTVVWTIPNGWEIQELQTPSTIDVGETKLFEYSLVPRSLGNFSLGLRIDYTSWQYGKNVTHFVAHSVDVWCFDKPQFNIAPSGDVRKLLGVSGTPDYLNVFWNVTYMEGSIRDVTVTCWLNYGKSCKGYRRSSSCTIFHPNYNASLDCSVLGCTAGKNLVLCTVNDSEYPKISNVASVSFRHLDFEMKLPENVTFTVGSVILPFRLKNLGLLPDNYSIGVTTFPTGRMVVTLAENSTPTMHHGEIYSANVRILVLLGGESYLNFLVNSTTDPRVWKSYGVKVKAGHKALSGMNEISVFTLLLLSAGVFFVLSRRNKF